MKKSELTRLKILQEAYKLIYTKGFQQTSIDDILATTNMTKGAFYYHFKHKDDMMLAILHELLQPEFVKQITEFFEVSENPIDALYAMIAMLLSNNDSMSAQYGCPLANFVQELTPDHSTFTKVLQNTTELWVDILIRNIKKGQEIGVVRLDINPHAIAMFIISSYWGIRNFGRIDLENKVYTLYLTELKNYLRTLSL